MEIIVFILAMLIIFYLTRSESFTNAPDTDYVQSVATVTADLNQSLIFATRDYLQKNLKLCGYCIETRSIKMFTNKNDKTVKYRCVYMFLITDGYPYAISINVDIGMTPAPTVLLLSTQPADTISSSVIQPYTDEDGKKFLSFDEINALVKPKNLPTISQ